MNPFWKDIFREIKTTVGRFFSLIIIAVLGAASFVGIQAASIDMRDVANRLYKSNNLYDLQLKSTTGFTQDDVTALSGAKGVKTVMPTYIFDTYIIFENETDTVRTYALPDTLNTIELLQGRLPENASECVVEKSFLHSGNYKLGDTVKLGLDNKENYFDVLSADTFTITGVVSSPLYISKYERGNTSLGNGTLDYYIYLHPDAYVTDVYTDIYLLMKGSQEINSLSDDYCSAAAEWKHTVQETGDVRVLSKKDELSKMQSEINDGWSEYYDGVKKLNEKISEGEKELDDAKIKLDEAKAKLDDGQNELDQKIAEAENEINEKSYELAEGQAELDAKINELENGQIQLNDAMRILNENLAVLESMGPRGVSPDLDDRYEKLYAELARAAESQAELDEGRKAAAAALEAVNDGINELDSAKKLLDQETDLAQREIDEGMEEYKKGLLDYKKGTEELKNESTGALAKLADSKKELEDAQKKLDGAPTPEWFYFVRKDGVAYDSYYQDTIRLQKIGYVFPLVFFLVAVMVSLTSMSRMVEERRTQIGIYKALGYRPGSIMTKYFVYSFGASFTGGVLGVCGGSVLLPITISDAYNHLYDMPPVKTPVPVTMGIIAVVSATASVVLVSLLTCANYLRSTPSTLMRPKPPSSGKRVLLERIGFIWNRLGFIGKVTARNVFRYKKRFFMTLFGVAGCLALLLTAFGLRDSIGGVSSLQYNEIIKYNTSAYLKDMNSQSQYSDLNKILPEKRLYISEKSVDVNGNNSSLTASVIVPEEPEKLSDFINLRSPSSEEDFTLSQNSVLVTEKLARVMGVSSGGSINVTTDAGKAFTIPVTEIVDNYVLHYIYMSPEMYFEVFGEKAVPNIVFAIAENENTLAEKLLGNSNVRAVLKVSDLSSNLNDSTDAMGIVTVVLIILACALALVVLFNLTAINIAERTRELATIKVLGFYDSELSMYIHRESTAVTVLGILLGIAGGIFLHRFVLASIEIDLLKFPHIVRPQSYLFAIALSASFAVFVNLVMNYKLTKINMVESMKSVE